SDGESGAYNFTTVGVDGSGLTSATLAGLQPYTRYSVVLQAFNSKGAGPASLPKHGETMQEKPSAPPDRVKCESLTSESLLVTWSRPPQRFTNGLIINYRVIYYNSGEQGAQRGSVLSEGFRATLSSLHPWTNYSVAVAAATQAGEGVASTPVLCTTDQDVPSAPAGIKAVPSGPRSVVISWAAPQRSQGQLTQYTLHWLPVGTRGASQTRRLQPSVNHHSIADLKQSSYEVWVTASTNIGEGPSSSKAVVTPSHKVSAGVWSVGSNMTAAWK
ncbi:unnamed protein product, partial [Meganyctiphanes norvegica]